MNEIQPTLSHNLRSAIFSDAWMMDRQSAQGFFFDIISEKASQDEAPELNLSSVIHFVSPDGQVSQFGEDNITNDSVAVIRITGPMLKYSYIGWFSAYWGTLDISRLIKMCSADSRVNAIVLLIDSGGGQVSAIAPLVQAIQESKVPIVAHCDIAASAAYWVASECRLISLDNTINSAVGSIGVYTSWADMKGYYEQMGVKFHEVYAPESSEKNKEMREANEDNYKLLQENILSPMAQRFQEAVRSNRKLKSEKPLAGAMYFADEAKSLGLADTVMTLDKCIEVARSLSSIKQ